MNLTAQHLLKKKRGKEEERKGEEKKKDKREDTPYTQDRLQQEQGGSGTEVNGRHLLCPLLTSDPGHPTGL